ncbi:hypothetical protein [Streptacidiphilus fuscans]|uniref:Uncharacterized protein n=1 Tax=Streptacidiphilus fuscans TaxID=2789292 RepID=A0A931FCZ6_9ACTN|nr:hypothetical protein [Streptacidiphilus fuscans]MBF9069018.1 hypothetical protein [Streptacidiphilus fuscans]
MTDHLTALAVVFLIPATPVLLLANILTLADVLSAGRHAWSAAGLNRRRWIAATVVSLVLLPMGLVVSAMWRLRARRRLAEVDPGSVNPLFNPKKSSLFDAATTWPARLVRGLLVALAAVGVGLGVPRLIHDSVGDPAEVGITDLNHDIAPKPWIEQHCTTSVVHALHLDNAGVQENGHYYQRWTVTPKPGHLDRVLLDMDSGTVICP